MSRPLRLACMLLLPLPALPGPAAAAAGAVPADSLAAPPPAVRAWQTGLRPDRLQHAGLAFTVGLGAGLATRRATVAAVAPCALGLLNEARDARRGRFDAADLATGGIGAALAALATLAALR
jgi:hypothetical protein